MPPRARPTPPSARPPSRPLTTTRRRSAPLPSSAAPALEPLSDEETPESRANRPGSVEGSLRMGALGGQGGEIGHLATGEAPRMDM
jgi:hypothetical protein